MYQKFLLSGIFLCNLFFGRCYSSDLFKNYSKDDLLDASPYCAEVDNFDSKKSTDQTVVISSYERDNDDRLELELQVPKRGQGVNRTSLEVVFKVIQKPQGPRRTSTALLPPAKISVSEFKKMIDYLYTIPQAPIPNKHIIEADYTVLTFTGKKVLNLTVSSDKNFEIFIAGSEKYTISANCSVTLDCRSIELLKGLGTLSLTMSSELNQEGFHTKLDGLLWYDRFQMRLMNAPQKLLNMISREANSEELITLEQLDNFKITMYGLVHSVAVQTEEPTFAETISQNESSVPLIADLELNLEHSS